MSTTITGTIRNLATSTVGSANNSLVRFILRGTGGNQPRVTGTAGIAPLLGGNGLFYTDLAADVNGVVSGTIYSTRDAAGTGNGDIAVGGSNTSVWYGMVIYANGLPGPETPVHAKSGVTLDISNVTPITTLPVVTAPTGDSTYLRLDGGNSPITGGFTSQGTNSFTGSNLFSGGGSMQGVWTAGPTYNISTVSETGNIVTVTTTTPCSAITATYQSIVVAGVGVSGYNSGPGGQVGFVTASACVGSSFTYFNPTSGLGASSGGTVVVSPIFSQGVTHTGPETISGQLTMTNHNNIFWAGPGATPTIDQAISACGTNPCFVEISVGYTGAESASVVTTSTGHQVFSGANNVTIIDRRAITSGSGIMYPVMYGGRLAGQLERLGANYWSSSPPDSTSGATSFNWFTGTAPSNSGAINGNIGVTVVHGAITMGSSLAPFVGQDAEAYINATSSDIPVPTVTGITAGSGISRTNGAAHVIVSAGETINACVNASSSGAKIINCYGTDIGAPNAAVGSNYSIHAYGSNLHEVNTSLDYATAGSTLTGCTESGSTVTCTASAPCAFITGEKVRVALNTHSNALIGYEGNWTVLTPGCNGGSTFTYTATVSGMGAAGAGTASGIHKAFFWRSTNSAVELTPYLDSVGWLFNTNAGATVAQIKSTGVFVAGTLGPSADNAAFLGGSSLHWAGLFQTASMLGGASGTTSPAAAGGATSGKIAVPASQTTYTINAANVSTSSLIFIQQTSSNSGLPSSPTCNATATTPQLSAISNGVSFTFTLTSNANVTCYNWWFVN